MKWKQIGIAIAVAALLGTWVMAQAPKTEPVKMDDQRIERILAQNEKILKSQEEILRTLRELQQDVTVLKFRGH